MCICHKGKKIYRAGGHTDSPKTANKTTINFFFLSLSSVLLFFQTISFEDLILIAFAHLAEPLRIISLLFYSLRSSSLPSPLFNFSSRIPSTHSSLASARANAQPPIMVGSTLAMRSSRMVSPSAMRLSSFSRVARPLRSNGFLQQQSCQRAAARRTYADAAPAPTPAPKPKKKFRFLRWTWRLTLLTGAGLTGMLAYSIYELRHPIEQIEPDPSKKTLVVLGALLMRGREDDRGELATNRIA